MKVVGLVREILTNEITTLFHNDSQLYYVAKSIIICNTSASAQTVSVFFSNSTQDPTVGAVYFDLSLDANETAVLPDKIVEPNGRIRAYSGVTDVISFNADIFTFE